MDTNKILLEMLQRMATLESHSSEIKDDLKQHMKRTAILENETSRIDRNLITEIAWRRGALKIIGWLIGVTTAICTALIIAVLKGAL